MTMYRKGGVSPRMGRKLQKEEAIYKNLQKIATNINEESTSILRREHDF